MFFFDPMYLFFMIPALVLLGFAYRYVTHAYSKWSQVRATSGLTGHQAAQRLISTGNLYGVQVQGTAGKLTPAKLDVGDTVELFVEVFDKNPLPRPDGRRAEYIASRGG